MAGSSPHRIVILGGGFGGVYTARNLERRFKYHENVEITLVSRDNYFLMTPLLFEAGSGVLDPRHAVSPIRKMLRRTQFDEAEVERVDFDRRVVIIRHEEHTEEIELPYDQLVLALGGVTNTGIIPGSQHAATFKTLADAIRLRNQIIDTFEEADLPHDFLERRKLLTFVVVGAGLVGVELMGEFTGFVHSIARSYRNARQQLPQFHLIEAGPRILPEMDESLAAFAQDVLTSRGVKVHVSSPAKEIGRDRVTLVDGTVIEGDTIVLAAGVAPNPLLAAFPVAKDRKGRIAVDATMRSTSHPEAWAIGDCASIPDPKGKPYPQLAQHALREAKVLAHNMAVAHRRQGELKNFVYENMGTLAALGHFNGVGRVLKFKIKGFIAWWVWRSYYLSQMPRLERKLRIVLDWTVALFFSYDIVKLDLYCDHHPHERGRARGARPAVTGVTPKPEATRMPERAHVV
jgi:NADH:ubiquinone reductase (H+-translocating)